MLWALPASTSATDTVKRPASSWPVRPTAASWLRLPLGKCLRLPQVESHGCGAGLGGKAKLRWLQKGKGASAAWPHQGLRLRPPRPPKDRASTVSQREASPAGAGPQAPPCVLSTHPCCPTSPPKLGCRWPSYPLPAHVPPTCPGGVSGPESRQSAPRLQGWVRLVMIFCRMRKGS